MSFFFLPKFNFQTFFLCVLCTLINGLTVAWVNFKEYMIVSHWIAMVTTSKSFNQILKVNPMASCHMTIFSPSIYFLQSNGPSFVWASFNRLSSCWAKFNLSFNPLALKCQIYPFNSLLSKTIKWKKKKTKFWGLALLLKMTVCLKIWISSIKKKTLDCSTQK